MRYPKESWGNSEGCEGQDAALGTRCQMCAGRPRGVFRPRFRGRLGRGAGRYRTQWIGQNLAAAAGQEMFAGLMREHLAQGGLIIAATHAPLGIEARELRMGGAA